MLCTLYLDLSKLRCSCIPDQSPLKLRCVGITSAHRQHIQHAPPATPDCDDKRRTQAQLSRWEGGVLGACPRSANATGAPLLRCRITLVLLVRDEAACRVPCRCRALCCPCGAGAQRSLLGSRLRCCEEAACTRARRQTHGHTLTHTTHARSLPQPHTRDCRLSRLVSHFNALLKSHLSPLLRVMLISTSSHGHGPRHGPCRMRHGRHMNLR